MSIKSKFEKIDLEKLKSESPKAYGILNGWANSTKNFTDDEANEVIEPVFNKLYDKIATGNLWYVIEGNKQPKDQVAEPVTKKEEETIVKQVVKSEPKEPKVKATKTTTKKTHTSNANKPKHVPTPPKLGGKSVFEVAKELREKDPTLKQRDAVRMAGKMVKDAHNKAKDEELQSLMKMIKSDPRYSVLRPDKNTSIIRDLGRPAIRTTKRVSRKGWKNQYGASDGGRTYYENRVNRMDIDKVPMYADGGKVTKGKVFKINFNKSSGGTGYYVFEIVDTYNKTKSDLKYDVLCKIIESSDSSKVGTFERINKKLVRDYLSGKFSFAMELKNYKYAKGGELAGVVVYDNGGESFDRYTIFTPDGSVYGMSENASGFNMYIGDSTEIEKGSHLGKKLKSVPEGIKKAVLDRMSETFAKGGSVDEEENYTYRDFYRGQDLKFDTEEEAIDFINGTKPFVRKAIKSGELVLVFNGEQFYIAEKVKYAKGGEFSKSFLSVNPAFKYQFSVKRWLDDNEYDTLKYKIVIDFLKGEKDIDEKYNIEQDRWAGILRSLEKIGVESPHEGQWRNENYSLGEAENWVKDALNKYFVLKKVKTAKNESHLPTSDVEYFRKGKIDKLMIGGKEISEDDILSGVFAKKLGTGSSAVDDYDDEDDYNYNVGDKLDLGSRGIKYFKQWDGEKIIVVDSRSDIDTSKGAYIYPSQIKSVLETADDYDDFAKGGKVAKFDAYEVQEKIADLSYKVWNDLGIDSGSEIYESDAVQKKMASAYEKAGIDDLFTQYTESERKEIAEALTDENQHSLRQYLALRGYLGEAEKQDYTRLAKKYNVGGRKSFLEPKNIEEAKTTSKPKSGGKQGYIYVPKEDITSIEYMKDGESVIAKNSDILDGAYIKISSSSFAEGGRLPKGEVMYVPKKDIEDIVVSDSGFKAHNITDELLSGIHIKASALSNKPSSQSTSSKGATFDPTYIHKGFHGWVAYTKVTNLDGKDYRISTMKRSNGKLSSFAQEGEYKGNAFSYVVFQDPFITLIETKPAKVTEKVVSEQHDKAVAKFKEMKGV